MARRRNWWRDPVMREVVALSQGGGPPELVTNGGFSENIDSWASTLNSPTLSWASGRLVMTSTAALTSRFSQAIATEIGVEYTVSALVHPIERSALVAVSVNANLADMVATSSGVAAGTERTVSFTFTATATTMYVGGSFGANGVGQTAEFDNFSVKRL